MRNTRILSVISLSITILGVALSETAYAQVVGNAVTRGIRVGSSRASRGTSMMSRFNQFSTGSERFTMPIERTSRDPLSVRTSVNMRTPMPGLGGVSGSRAGSRPAKSNLLQPTRPAALNQLIFSKPNMRTLGSLPRDLFFKDKIEHKIGSLKRIIYNPGQFTIKPQHLLRPDIQQRNSFGNGLLRSNLSMAQRNTIIKQTPLTQNFLTSQNLQLSRTPTIFDIGQQVQNARHAPQSIFNVR